MGKHPGRTLGINHHIRGLQTRVHRRTSLQPDKINSSSFKSRSKKVIVGGGRQTTNKEGNIPNISSVRERVLVHILSGNKENGRLEANIKSQTAQPFYQAEEVPHGILINNLKVTDKGKLGDVDRSQRRLSPYTNTPISIQMASLYDQQASVRIQEPSFRTINSTKSVYSRSQGSRSMPTSQGHPNIHVPGRLANIRPYSEGNSQHNSNSNEDSFRAGVYHQHREIMSHPKPDTILSRSKNRSPFRIRRPITGENPETDSECQNPSIEGVSTSIGVASGTRAYGKHGGACSTMSATNESRPTSFHSQAQCHSSLITSPDPSHKGGEGRTNLVELNPQLSSRSSLSSTTTPTGRNNGRIQDRMGRIYSRTVSKRNMDCGGITGPHQFTGAMGCQEYTDRSRTVYSSSESVGEIRQFHSGFIHKQTRRNKIRGTVYGNKEADLMVPEHRDQVISSAHTGDGEYVSGQPLSGSLPESNGMVFNEDSISGITSEENLSNSRPILHQEKQTTTSVLHKIPRYTSTGSRCSINFMGGNSSVRIPSNIAHQQSCTEDKRGGMHDPLDSSIMAQAALVSKSPPPNNSRSNHPTSGSESPTHDRLEGTVPRHRVATSNCVDLIKQRFEKEGLSAKSADLAARGRRRSTIKIYNSRARPFIKWCKVLQEDPSTASLSVVADFLTSRFEKGLQSSTVRGYLSAIQSFHRGCPDGTSIRNNQSLRFLIEGMEIARPKVRNIWPAWDLPIVLEKLNCSPFEPLQSASIRNLAMKTLFLVAIASGKRCSELQALSIDKFTVFSKTGVTLYFRTGFMAKNERSNYSANPIFLPCLKRSEGRAQRLSCPVRAIKWYIDRTKIMRGKTEQLFITNKKPYRAAAKTTLAGWLVEVIQVCEAILENGKPRAHSVRAYSASWAHARGLTVSEILNTVSWKSDSTFTKVYLRDVHLRTAQGRYATQVLECGNRATENNKQ